MKFTKWVRKIAQFIKKRGLNDNFCFNGLNKKFRTKIIKIVLTPLRALKIDFSKLDLN